MKCKRREDAAVCEPGVLRDSREVKAKRLLDEGRRRSWSFRVAQVERIEAFCQANGSLSFSAAVSFALSVILQSSSAGEPQVPCRPRLRVQLPAGCISAAA